MPRAKALLTRLQAVDTRTSEIRALHTRLVAIWVDYLAALERFTDMPEGESTQDRRHVMEESLRKLYERWKAWNVELQERAG